MANDNEREARLARSLKRLDHRLVKRLAAVLQSRTIIQDEAVFAKRLSLDDVEAWTKEYIRPKPTRKA